MKVKAISIGPGEVAGYFSRLKKGFDILGINSEHFVLTSNKFSYHESDYFLKRIYLKISIFRESRIRLLRQLGFLVEFLLRTIIFLYALLKFDTFIFSGSGSFFKFHELPILRLFGKKIIVVYLGSDARPDYISGRYLDDVGRSFNYSTTGSKTFNQLKRIRKVEKYADFIVNHTATAQLFSREFVRLGALGTPIEVPTSIVSQSPIKHSKCIRILHAPSRPLAKGSFVFRSLIDELRVEGYEIDFVELVGVPNSVVLKEIMRCDFVLDELYSDMPMAMLATEAAMYSKPVVVGGYYARHYQLDNPYEVCPPSLYVDPSEIKEAIRKLIDDSAFRLALGREAYAFVSKYWNVRKVAENYLQLIQARTIPEHWKGVPDSFLYYWGWGLPKDLWFNQLNCYVSNCGSDALYLSHNPLLRESILKELDLEQGC